MRKIVLTVSILAIVTSVSMAEMNRTLYTKENRFPELYRPEVGVLYEYKEMNDRDEHLRNTDADLTTANLYSRIRPLEDLALRGTVPFSRYSPNQGEDHNGIGDVNMGVDLIAYESVFDYPYVIPHADYTFDTGDEDKHLGGGESFATLGIGTGTVVDDQYHWMLDVSYKVMDKTENAFVVGASFLWEINDQFSALAETQIEEKSANTEDEDDYAQYITGGLAYKATDNLSLALYGTGTARNTDEDVIVSVKASFNL